MSTRTIIEINHDRLIDLIEDRSFMADILGWLRSGDLSRVREIAELYGVRILGQRHHSEPEWEQRKP